MGSEMCIRDRLKKRQPTGRDGDGLSLLLGPLTLNWREQAAEPDRGLIGSAEARRRTHMPPPQSIGPKKSTYNRDALRSTTGRTRDIGQTGQAVIFLVAAQIGVYTEAAPTSRNIAAVWLLACVGVDVRPQTRGPRESLAAPAAFKFASSRATVRSARAARFRGWLAAERRHLTCALRAVSFLRRQGHRMLWRHT